MNALWAVVIVAAPSVTLVVITFLLERSRRSPAQQIDRAFRQHARNCQRKMHEWETPWQRGRLTRVYESGTWQSEANERIPIERYRTFSTQCRHCGMPTSKQVQE